MFFRKKKVQRRVFLDVLSVQPRGHLTKFLDIFGGNLPTIEYEQIIGETLIRFFEVPHVSERNSRSEADVALSIHVSQFEPGLFFAADVIPRFPIFYVLRASVTLKAHVFEIDSGKTLLSMKIKQTMPWRKTLKGVLFGMLGFGLPKMEPIFGPDSLRILLGKACERLIDRWRMVS